MRLVVRFIMESKGSFQTCTGSWFVIFVLINLSFKECLFRCKVCDVFYLEKKILKALFLGVFVF